jgi:WD40 repeat protein/beta-lactamase regulating signal transducer with metallopeptidase domain
LSLPEALAMPGAILDAVFGNLVVAAALAAAAYVVGRKTKRPAVVHAAWLLVLVKLVTPPLFTVRVPCLPGREPAVNPAGPDLLVPPSDAATPNTVLSSLPPALPAPPPPSTGAGPAAAVPPRPATSAPRPATSMPWQEILLGVWAGGSLVWVVVIGRRIRQFVRLLRFAAPPPPWLVEDVTAVAARMGLGRLPRVRILPGVVPPFVWAAGRPTLYFPASLLGRVSAEGRRTLLAHELAHLRRRDHIVRWVEFIALAVYWWCPLAWLARRELRRLEEEACDAQVGEALPGTAFAYASAVMETIDFLSCAARVPGLASAIGHADPLRRRLVLILDGTQPARPRAWLRLALTAGGLILLAAGLKAERFATPDKNATLPVTHQITMADGPAAEGGDEAPAGLTLFLPKPTRLLAAHGNAPCLAAALSPDGRRLAVACGADVMVWDVVAQQVRFTLTGHTDAVNAVAFSPDGSRIATAGNDGLARLWDAADGRQLHTLAGHKSWVTAAAFAPDGRTLATGGYDKTVRLWDVASGTPRATWVSHSGGVRAVAFAPDGRTLASGGADCEVRVWDAGRGVARFVLKKHTGPVRAVAFAPDGCSLASTSEDYTVRIWDVAAGHEAGTPVALPDHGTALGFSACGQSLLVGTLGGHLLNVDPAAGHVRQFLGVEPGKPVDQPAHADALAAVLAPAAAGVHYSVSQDQAVFAWTPAAPPRPLPPGYRAGLGPVTAVALSPDGRTLATGGPDGVIRLLDVGTGTKRTTLPGHPGGVTALQFVGRRRLLSAGADERVRCWDLAAGRAVGNVLLASPDLRIALSPDGHTVAVVSARLAGVTLWDFDSGGGARQFGETAGGATAVAFSPAGDRLATGYADGMVRLWDPAAGDEIQRGPAGRGQVDGIAFEPGGETAAVVVNGAGGSDTDRGPVHEVVFWDARDGSVREAPRRLAHPGPVTAAAFTADAGRLLTAAHDGNLYVWDLPAGRVAGTIRSHAGPVRGVALAPDGKAVFSAGDRAARRWPMPPRQSAQRPAKFPPKESLP